MAAKDDSRRQVASTVTSPRTYASSGTYAASRFARPKANYRVNPDRPFVQAPITIAAKEEDLIPYMGDSLTAMEIAAVQRVHGRLLPMSELPMNTADVPRILYRQRVYSVERPRSTHHYGQRKLLTSEVKFVLDNACKGDTIVYAGSAPGIHIPFLSSLFRRLDLQYVLIDPRPFRLPKNCPGSTDKMEVRQAFFTDETATEFANRDDVLFISDVRSGTDEPEIPSDATVEADMKLQENWVHIMNPKASLLKYRLNYTKSGSASYLSGNVRIQVWPGPTSTETRLEVRRPCTQTMTDAHDHEERMAYINTILREWASYDHGVPLWMAPGLDRGFDSACEVRVWRQYLMAMGGLPPEIRPVERRRPARCSAGEFLGVVSGDAEHIAALISATSTYLRRGLDGPDGPQRRL